MSPAADELKFEWDDVKASSNLEKHGVSFLTAAAIFLGEVIERMDDRRDYGELRLIALGQCDGEVFRVVYTRRGENLLRIINAHKAGRHEREIYHRKTLSPRDSGQSRSR